MINHDYRVVIGDSREMAEVNDGSIHLIVTSPPYPMVAIWDDFFTEVSASTYDAMHEYLNQVWREVERVLVPGGIACINIGDATRTRDGLFHLYPNHSRIIENFEKLGFVTLPYILWKKPTTKPTTRGRERFSDQDSSHQTPTLHSTWNTSSSSGRVHREASRRKIQGVTRAGSPRKNGTNGSRKSGRFKA